jgi:Heterokaryon incompatibility protein (HET)
LLGDANHRTGITCSDSQLKITVSLFGALRRFRDDSLPRILWADAVCIDQSDVEEKSHQVNLMGEIYGRASRVLIWLGEDPDGDAGEALQFIKDINRHFEREVLNISAKQEPQSQMSISRTIHDLPALANNSPFLSLASWQIFKSLLSRPYFSRVWVLQEVGLAEEAWAFVGEESIQLSEIVQACLLTSFHSELALVPVNLPTGRILDTCSNIWSGFGRERSWLQELPILQQYTAHCVAYLHALTVVDVLNTARRFQASEPCDYVYALLGIMTVRTFEGTH